jgi:shikimate dehydrogenase
MMKFGLIGKPLGHSMSPRLHAFFTGEEYVLKELDPEQLDGFFADRDFSGINVTIPYKLAAMEYMDEFDRSAADAGAINCIVNDGGKLRGYNTDLAGFVSLIKKHGMAKSLGNTAILGTGGAARAAAAAVEKLRGKATFVSRDPENAWPFMNGVISYPELYSRASEWDTIINATPIGMYPHSAEYPADLSKFPELKNVIDIVANPFRTRLVYEAQLRGINAAGGFEMLAAQALYSDRIFTGKDLPETLIEDCVRTVYAEQKNIVLIGMPSSGKTESGRLLAEKTGRAFADADDAFEEAEGMAPGAFIDMYGEAAFRKKESKVLQKLSALKGSIIACGGGAVLKKNNMRHLAENGVIIWLDRSPQLLKPSEETPLSRTAEDMDRLYAERLPLYERYADLRVPADGTPEETAETVKELLEKEL